MASSNLLLLTLLTITILLTFTSSATSAEFDDTGLRIMTDPLEWPAYSQFDGEIADDDELSRRSLFWRAMHYYISYGALSANRIPCPPRSGRSYYTHNCFKARGPVHPYTRGCSAITRCRR